MTQIALTNPWTKVVVYRDTTELVERFDAYVNLMPPETIEEINDRVASAWCERTASLPSVDHTADQIINEEQQEWLAAWADFVGPEEAGRIILGS